MILLDTSGLLAALDSSQRRHEACKAALEHARGPFVLSPFVLAELDYLLAKNVGAGAQQALLEEVARGAYRLESFGAPDVERAAEVMEKFRSLEIGLADASIVVLAERTGARDVLTLDARHFSVLRDSRGKGFRLRPSA
ncbi:MAG: PIN domain-containing protein [Planctomycetia bacterium]|nr:PIN domain-containing protein [Planctomycetia bacterium]